MPNKRVLIVEDSSLQRHMLSVICYEAGYQTILVTNGLEALEALDELSFDLIITDLEMPKMDGLQFLRRIAELNINSNIMLISGHSESLLNAAQELANQFGLNIVGTLKKPYIPETFLKTLNEMEAGQPDDKMSSQFMGSFQGMLSCEAVKAGLESGALTSHYQPKVRYNKGVVIGFESLARWTTVDGKTLGPATFIPTAEVNGLINPLTDQIMELSFADLARWTKKGFNLPVSINISPDNLKDVEFPDRVKLLVEKYNVDPASIVLELTESKVLENATDCLEVMSRLRLMHFGLSIDDFGTGYSSLKQLQFIPFTELKLDRSYVAAATHHPTSRTVLETGINLAKSLSLTCIAEGVETKEQAALLSSLGCDRHQGYLYAKPMPRDEVQNWLSKWHNTNNTGNKSHFQTI